MKNLLHLLFLLLAFTISKAQVIPKDIVDRINNSEYIFEGKVIRSNSYFTLDQKMIYTSSTIDIYKIFKGNLTCGTIEVLTQGGCVGDICLTISHNLELKKEMLGVFMCNPTSKELPLIDYYPESNVVKLDFPYDIQGYIKYFDDDFNKQIVDYQYSFDSLAQVYNLMDLYTQLNYINCHGSPFTDRDNLVQARKVHNDEDRNIKEYVDAINLRSVAVSAVDTQLTYTLMNPQITGTAPKYFEFDLGLSDNENSIYFMNAFPKFSYDTVTFGAKIDSIGKIWVTNSTLLADTTTYLAVGVSDHGRDKFSIEIGNKNPLAFSINLVDLPSTPTPAVHIKMEIKNCSHSSYILQTFGTLPYIPRFGLDPINPITNRTYDTLDMSSNLYFSGCGPVQIFAINPEVVAAGIGDTVTITGSNFGASQGSGNIFLKDANQGGQYYINLDSIDIKSWTNTEIKFVMPGVVDSLQQTTNIELGVPGTGPLKIQTSNGDSAIGFIKVRFALTSNVVDFTGTQDKFPVTPIVLANINREGIKFTFDSSFTNHPERMMVFKKAMKDWICLADMHFEAGDSLIDSLHIPDGSDTLSMVEFGPLPIGTLGQTYLWSSNLNPCGSYYWKPDIFFNEAMIPSLWCDTSTCDTVPIGKHDLYGIALHELGHAHGITHQNDPTKILYYGTTFSPTNVILPQNRQIYLLEDSPADSAAHSVMSRALDPNVLSCVRSIMGGFVNSITPIHFTDCGRGHRVMSCYWIGIEELERTYGKLSLYPNPANSLLTLELAEIPKQTVLINIFDITGRQINKEPLGFMKGENKIQIDIADFNTGVYLLKFVSSNANGGAMFIKN